MTADASALYAWGNGVYRIELPSLRRSRIASGDFGDGGCTYDIDSDGILDVVVQEGRSPGKLAWINGRDGESHTIDSNIEMHDCLVMNLLGKTGVLMIQRGIQVRFYSLPDANGQWGYREIYSFYTPSYQTSLVPADVDVDGFTDIFCGNYWLKSPQRFDLPWHIFAINTYSETPKSAMLRVAQLDAGRIVVAQSHMSDARLTVFEKPDDPRRPWIGDRLESDLHLVNPHGLVALDERFMAGENNAEKSRLFYFRQKDDGSYEHRIVRVGMPVIGLWGWRGAVVALWPESAEIIPDLFLGTRRLRVSSPRELGQTDRALPFPPAPPPNAGRSGQSGASAPPRR
jgi:hypothetical protein